LKEVVVDASVALAWCFPDETSEYADAVLVALEGQQVLVPSVWSLEITNAITVAQRRNRINSTQSQRFIELLEGLTIREAVLSLTWSVSNVLPLAQKYDLSAYDASYLAIAIRHSVPLATLDAGLTKAATKAGIEIFLGTGQ
jgi:predicted nucleic acid-binding protein